MGIHHLAIPVALDGGPAGWFAPTYKLLDEAWASALDVLGPLGSSIRVSQMKRQIDILETGGRIDFWTLSTSTEGRSQAGRGRKYKRVFVDEAAHAKYLEDDWTKAIRPTLADLRGDAWFLSTPRGHDYFHKLWARGQKSEPGYASWRMPTASNPFIHPDEIEAARVELPADAYAQEYLGEFLADAANPFGIHAIRACIVDGFGSGPVDTWGVDLAKSTDWTVAIGLNDQGEVCAFQRWQSDWMNTTKRVAAMIGDTPALIDSTGVGDPIVEQLQAVCRHVEGYKFSAGSKQQIMEGLAWAIQNGVIAYPDGPIVHELEIFQYEYRPSGVRYTAPEGEHDDCVDALALAVRCATTRPDGIQLAVGARDTSRVERNWITESVENPDIWSQF